MEPFDEAYATVSDYFGIEPGELVQLFPGFSVLHSWEGLGPEHRHGDGPVERHGRAEAILRR